MPFIAISYQVKPGHEDDIAEIFAEGNFTRADSPVLRGDDGAQAGRNLGTSLFIRHDMMARFVHFEGEMQRIGPHMSGQRGVKEAELKLGPYLATPRDTQTPDGFMHYFRNAMMTCILHRETQARPGPMVALRYTVAPDTEDKLRDAFEALHPDEESLGYPESGQPVVNETAFVKGAALVRMMQYDGTPADLVAYLDRGGHGKRAEEALAPYLDEPDARGGGYPAVFAARAMRCIQHLSIDRAPTGS